MSCSRPTEEASAPAPAPAVTSDDGGSDSDDDDVSGSSADEAAATANPPVAASDGDSDGDSDSDSDDSDGGANPPAAAATPDSDGSNDSDSDDAADSTDDKRQATVPVPVPAADGAKAKKPKSARAASASTDGRCVVFSGLPKAADAKTLYKRCRKIGEIEGGPHGVTYGAKNTAEVIFATHKDARAAVTKLNQATFKGAKIKAVLKTKSGKDAKPVLDAAAASGAAAVPGDKGKRFRLIIRNLAFTTNENLLRAAAAKFGPVTEVQIVKDKVTKKPRGFAFVRYKSAIDAGVAVTGLNGKSLGGRKIAVDWTLAKNEYEANMAKTEKPESKPGADKDKGGGSDDDGSDGSGSDDGSDEEDEEEEEEEDADDDSDEEEEEEEKSSDVGQGCTLFIRNVSFDTKADQLTPVFTEFGTVVMCKVVEDFNTGRSRGTAFVKFKNRIEAEECLARAGSNLLAPIECDGRTLNIALVRPGDIDIILDPVLKCACQRRATPTRAGWLVALLRAHAYRMRLGR